MTKWDIYMANVPFEDLPQSKIRPVIVLEDSVAVVECLKMTSHLPRPGEYALRKWKEAGLRKATTVRLSKRLALSHCSFLNRIGSLHIIDIVEIEKRLAL